MNGKHPIRLRMINAACIVVFILAASFAGPRNRVSAAVSPVFVPANALWVQTGIFLEKTHDVFLEAHGMAITGKINLLPESKSGPEGQVWNCGQSCALDGAPYGALVGKIIEDGEEFLFLIGNEQSFEVPATGYLFLAVNDNLGFYGDNHGGFNVIIRGGNMAGGYIAARPDIDVIDGRYWTPGEVVRLKIFNRVDGLLYQDSQIAGEYDSAGTNVSFNLAENGFDLAIGQRVLMSSGGHTRELWIAPIAVTGYSFQGEPWISGTCDPGIFCWAHLDDRDPKWIDMDDGNWKVYFDYLVPWEGGWAFQWDLDGDETRIRFHINTPDARMISAFPEWDIVQGTYWKVGDQVTMNVYNGTDHILEDYKLNPALYDQSGGSFFEINLGEQGIDIQPGYTIKMENNWIKRELVVSPIVVTGNDDTSVFGTCDPEIFCWAHLDDRDPSQFDPDGGNWIAYFDHLIPGERGWAFQWDLDGDETRIRFQIDQE